LGHVGERVVAKRDKGTIMEQKPVGIRWYSLFSGSMK
jgi:hypothetical protein